MKKDKRAILIGTLVILSTMVMGVILYPRLPEQIATHFDSNGNPNGFSSKPFTVFGLPLFLAVINLFVWFSISTDPKRNNLSPKIKNIVVCIIPVTSILVMVMTYTNALNLPVNVTLISNLFVAFLFLAIGNYMPKSKQTYTVGIRLPWTLNDEDNWNKTHRLAGYVWSVGGLIMLVNTFLSISWILWPVIICITFIPAAYSFLLYQKNVH